MFAEDASISKVTETAFERLRSEPWFLGWKKAEAGVPRRVVQKVGRLASKGFQPVWMVEVKEGTRSVGCFMLEEKAPFRWVEFSVDAEEPFCNGRSGCVGLEGVPNLQQFAMRGKTAERVASGCVPTAAANVIGYWAAHGLEWWLDRGPREEALRSATQRLRGDLLCMEIPDDAGYTDNGMPLTGSHAFALSRTLARDAARYGILLSSRAEAFNRDAFEREIREGRPVVVCGEVRLPHKPELSWGHAVTGIGWAEFDGEYFVMVRDNFYPTPTGNAVRWLRADALSDLVVVAPK